jgi:alpha-beta hydrolase superfamily lysophospholipase
MNTTTFTLQADDGQSIHVYHWSPAEEPRATIQIVHGLAEHAARYKRLAERLTAAGLDVYASDHRGHGKTANETRDLGFFAEHDGWHRVLGDLVQLDDRIAAEHTDRPRLLLGHSMGSFFAQHLAIEEGARWRGIALSGSAGPIGPLRTIGHWVARFERWRVGSRGVSGLLHQMSFGDYNKPFKPARTEFDWLSRDEAEVDKYVADPLCGFRATAGLWVDLLGGLGELHKPVAVARVPRDLPIYVVAGSRDPVSNGTKTLRTLLDLYAAARLTNVTHRFYEDGRHELLNDTNRDEVIGHLVEWIDGVLV